MLPVFVFPVNKDYHKPQFKLQLQYNTIQWVFLEHRDVYAQWVGTEALGEVTLRPKSQRQLWTVQFSVLIWRWPSCHFGKRSY